MAAAVPSASPWLRGPVSDVLLGSGLLYVPLFGLFLLLGGPQLQVFGAFSLIPLLVLFFSNPHLGATLLRVYERPGDRRAYHLFAVWATLPLALSFLVGLWIPLVGSILVTLYLTVVPWHFTGQNYGIALVFLRRRGIEIRPDTKRYIYASFAIPYVLWILALHGAQPGTVEYAPLDTAGTIYRFLPLGIPGPIQGYGVIVAFSAYVWVLGESVLRLLRRAPARELLPAGAVALSQALWFAAPVVAALFLEPSEMGPLSPGNAGYAFAWISVLHALQYLWITTYYVRKERPGTRAAPFLGKALLAGTAVYGIPLLLLSPDVFGRVSYDAGLFLMLAGALNLHHVMLDGVIWKLRNARIARILIRGGEETSEAPVAAPRRSWLKPLVLASGALGVTFALAGAFETQIGLHPAARRGDVERLERAVSRLAWMGRDDSVMRAQLGYLKAKRGDMEGALREYERSAKLRPSAMAWVSIGALREQEGRVAEALRAYERALEIDPDHVDALRYAGRAWLEQGRPERGRPLLARAASLAPDRPEIRRALDASGAPDLAAAP